MVLVPRDTLIGLVTTKTGHGYITTYAVHRLYLFDLILYVPSTIFQLIREESSWDCVAAVERLPALHYSVDFIFLSFGIMGFIVEL